MKQFIGKYIGIQKIKKVEESDEVTYLGNPKLIVTYDNGESECLPKRMVECSITEKVSDLTELRDARVKPVITELLTILTEAELTKRDIEYAIGAKLMESINIGFRMANEILWKKEYDDVTMRDADLVLKKGVKAKK